MTGSIIFNGTLLKNVNQNAHTKFMNDEQVGEDRRLVWDTCRGLKLKPTRPVLRRTGTPRTYYGAEKKIKKCKSKRTPNHGIGIVCLANQSGRQFQFSQFCKE